MFYIMTKNAILHSLQSLVKLLSLCYILTMHFKTHYFPKATPQKQHVDFYFTFYSFCALTNDHSG